MPRGTVVHYKFVGLIYTIFNFCSFVGLERMIVQIQAYLYQHLLNIYCVKVIP